jgi:hypothetical protein
VQEKRIYEGGGVTSPYLLLGRHQSRERARAINKYLIRTRQKLSPNDQYLHCCCCWEKRDSNNNNNHHNHQHTHIDNRVTAINILDTQENRCTHLMMV